MDGQDQVVGTQKLPSVNNKNKQKQLDRFEDKTEVKDKNEMNENSLKQLVGDGDLGDIDSCEKQDAVKDKQTDKKQHLASNKVLDTRLVCMLDDHCIMAVSPVSGIVLNIIYPLPDLDMPSVHVDLEENGNNCYVVLSDGQLMEYDCSVNPGQIGNIVKPGKRKQKIMSVVVMPVYLDVDSETTGQRLQAVLIGLDNGYIKLYDGGEKSNEPRTEGEGGRKISVRCKTNINDVGPYLVMDDIKAHFGEVVLLCSPFEGSFRYKSETVHNTLISCGSDERIIIWRASTADTNNTIYLQIMMQKLKIIKLCEVSSCIGLTDNVILFGFINGVIELHKAEWKQMEAMKGAEITFAGSKTLLSHVKRISLDPELCHKDVVTSVSESHLLQLFATTSKDKFIKIWNTEGQLIREVLLGDVVTSVCFANGRDLLASLHNHIVRMEAHAYLPTEYLEKILSIADEFGISELEPEVPIPMEGSTDKMVCVIQGGEEEEESEPFDKWSTTPKKREVSSPVKTVRRNRQTLEMYLKLQQEEEQEEVFMETSLQKREAPVSRNVDKAALLISKLDLEKMEKYPIAPDGYIPNSVIRQKVFPPPPLPPPPFFKIPSSISSSTIGFAYSQEYVLDEFSDWDLTKYMHYDSSSGEERWSDIEDYGFSSNCGQWEAIRELRHFELKKYLKGRREEGNMKIVITPKRGKPRIKKLPVKTPSPEPEVVEEPEPEPVSIVDDTPPTPPPQPDKLSLLLNEVSRQMWCPRKITVDLLEYELPVLASVLEKSGRKITSAVCHYLSLIHDACTEYMEQSGENLFPEEIESEFAENLSKLLLSQYASCQIAAAEVITKFNIKFIKDAILSVLMPQFMKSDGSGISEDPEVISFASSVIAKLSPLISVEDLIHISKMMSIGDFLHTRINEEETTNIISSSLLQAGVEFTDVAVWASFILPLLPEKPPPPKPKRKPSVMPTLAKQNSFIKKNVEKVIAPPSPIIPSEPVQTDSIRDISTQKLSVIKMPQQEFDTLVFQPSTTSTDSSGSDRDSFLYYNPPRPSIEEKRSDVSLPNQIPETNFPSELALVNELRRMSNTEEFSLIRPVSLTNTLKKHSSTRFSLLDVTRSKEKNLRKESVQLLKVMKRVSTSKSMHDLHKVGPVKASRVITKESKTMISPSLSDVASVQSWKETIETAPTNDTKEGSKVSPVTNGSGGTDKSSESLVVSRGRDKLSSSDSSKSTVLIPPPFEQRIDSPIPEKKYKPPPIYAKISVKPAVRIKKEAEVVLPEISEASSNSSTIYPVYSLSGGDETKITTSLSSPDTSGVEIAQWRVILRNLRITRITKSQKRKAALTETNLTSLARPTLPTIQNWSDSFTVTNCRPKVTSPGRSLQRRVSDRLRKESRTMRTPAFAVARRRSAEGLTSKFEWATPFAPAHVRHSIR
uniref:uncharacterized protein LOC100175990 isoform X1 n=1 Tax=Ciona intestinalis TaxID=7719 RepID=UPI000EF479AD|nr:uncharacterized protein LOC100175990 isoform X1 [Ciona intestinalis]|eukprot:XP_026696387.1 uncharacterized protein LOC100175990 isoform X1 [Ciona intestinalis]